MASFASASKTIVIRTSRDTLGLVAAATAVTFAMAYAIHAKHDSLLVASAAMPSALVAQDASPQGDWAGHLAEVTPAAMPTPAEPMTSASLTVPKRQLALPTPMTARLPTKPRPCTEPQPCALKALAATSTPAATHHQASAVEKAQARERRSLIGMLNPLNHLPDMSTVSRPFTYASGTVTGWFKRL